MCQRTRNGGPDRRAAEWSPECLAPERLGAAGVRGTAGDLGTAGVRAILGPGKTDEVLSGKCGHTGALERRVTNGTESEDRFYCYQKSDKRMSVI